MHHKITKQVSKFGQPPGTALYTGNYKLVPQLITVITYSENKFIEKTVAKLEDCIPNKNQKEMTWIHVQGLHEISIIEQLAKLYNLHPLTVEDVLNVEQRPKVEEFVNYEFIILKAIIFEPNKKQFSTQQLSLILGNNFLLSFQESDFPIFNTIRDRLRANSTQRLRQQGSDYLAYRLLDNVVDNYFVILESLGNDIDQIEEDIIINPKPQNTRTIYSLKRQTLSIRKVIWPMREVVSHLLQGEENLITPFTRIYMRDLYDHIVQAIDTVETFRDMLSNLLDVYLSSLTNRMNEVMKTLTIIATIFIPITFIASLYGMNFVNMPELHWRWGYYYALSLMGAIAFSLLIYFYRKKWL
jgi:magnesium transporter